MSSTDAEQIKKMVDELDVAVSREGARVQLSQYGGGPDECKMVGNQRGYLRLGIEFLRMAFAPPSPKSNETIDVDLRYLLTDDSNVVFDWFERREDLAGGTKSELKPSKFFLAFVAFAFLSGLILSFMGLGTVIVWLVGLSR